MLLAPVVVIALAVLQSVSCADAASCRQAALDAAARQDFEAFHDLAWQTARKGKPNDPELMLLLARAQSLSGRPGDALVMLRRLASTGFPVDVTSDDFRRVRALPAWPEVEAMFKGTPPAPAIEKPVVEKPTVDKSTVEKPANDKPPASPPARVKSPAASPPPAAAATSGAVPEPLTLVADGLDPVGIAYDQVSRRFIVGDRRTNKLLAVDEVFRRTSDMVSARSGGFIGLTALKIDRPRGDLWIANSAADRSSVHKLQLVSGRTLFSIDAENRRIVDLAIAPSGIVFVLDAARREVLRVKGDRLEPVMNIIGAAPSSLAYADGGLYVAYADGLLRADIATGSVKAIEPREEGALQGVTHLQATPRGLVALRVRGGQTEVVRIRADAGPRARVEAVEGIADIAPSSPLDVDGADVVFLTSSTPPTIRRVRLR